MNPWLKWSTFIFFALVAGSGLVLAWMIWMLEPINEWAVVHHPWQSHTQHLHVLLAPGLVLVIGALLQQHGLSYWFGKVWMRRKSGGLILFLALPMIFSGTALQVSVEQSWRQFWSWFHGISSLLWTCGLLAHLFIGLNKILFRFPRKS